MEQVEKVPPELEWNQRAERTSRLITVERFGSEGNSNHGERRREFHVLDGGAGELQQR